MRSVVTFMLACCLLAGATAGAGADQSTRVTINGKQLASSATRTLGGIAYIRLRPLADALGATVAFDGHEKAYTVTTLLRQVSFRADDSWATVNGDRVRLTQAPRSAEDTLLIALRALPAAFGVRLSYDARSHSIAVATGTTGSPYGEVLRPNAAPATTTIDGTVTNVSPDARPPSIQITANGQQYALSVPTGMRIQFRDIHGAVTGDGSLAQVKAGDALIATLDASGRVMSVGDIFATVNGTIAAVAGGSMVLTNGKVISADPASVSVTLAGKAAAFSDLKGGDKVSVRSDPKTGKVNEVVVLTARTAARSATSTPPAGASSGGSPSSVQISAVTDNADRALRASQILKVQANGTVGAQASFDLSDVIVANPMQETRAGHYEGSYRVDVGTNLTDAPIIVQLRKNGDSAVAEAPDPLNIVTTPPSIGQVAPDDGARINSARPNIFATFNTVADKGMDSGSLRMSLNGGDVTSRTTRTGAFIAYYPPSDLAAGTVLVEVRGSDIAGNAVRYKWSFVVGGR